MADIFTQAIQTLADNGFYVLFTFILTVALFYALLRKSKVFGEESDAVNGIISIVIGFMVLGYQVFTGLTLQTPLATFFTQATVIILFFMLGILLASFFYPNLSEWLTNTITRRGTFFGMIVFGLGLLVVSGLLQVLLRSPPPPIGSPVVPTDVTNFFAAIVIFIVVLILAVTIPATRED